MKRFSLPVLLFAFLTVGCAHSTYHDPSFAQPALSREPQLIMVASNAEQIFLKSKEMTSESKK